MMPGQQLTITKMVKSMKQPMPADSMLKKRVFADMAKGMGGSANSLDKFRFSGMVTTSVAIKHSSVKSVDKSGSALKVTTYEPAANALDPAQQANTEMGNSGMANKVKIISTSEVISSLKKVFSSSELKIIVT